jgi:hypothetical protein
VSVEAEVVTAVAERSLSSSRTPGEGGNGRARQAIGPMVSPEEVASAIAYPHEPAPGVGHEHRRRRGLTHVRFSSGLTAVRLDSSDPTY